MPPILLLVGSFGGLALHGRTGELDAEHDTVRIARAVTSMFVWFKFFLLLRCMTLTAYLVQMIIQVFADIKAFLLILGITLIAFADSWHAISSASPDPGEREAGYLASLKYIFVVTIGMAEGDILETTSPVAFLVFFLAAGFNLIVLLNLLIAIISETYWRVKRDKDKFLFKLKVSIIVVLQSIVLGQNSWRTYVKSDTTKLLFFAQCPDTAPRSQAHDSLSDRRPPRHEDEQLRGAEAKDDEQVVNEMRKMLDEHGSRVSAAVQGLREKASVYGI